MNKVKSEASPSYDVFKTPAEAILGDNMTVRQAQTMREQAIIDEAKCILLSRLQDRTDQPAMSAPEAAKDYCILQLAERKNEAFCCLFLDNRHRLIKFEEMFQGTVSGATVFPRVVVQRALELNAQAVIFAHNHPSGVAQPSEADQQITTRLRDAMALIDIRVLDHIIVALDESVSMAEMGLV